MQNVLEQLAYYSGEFSVLPSIFLSSGQKPAPPSAIAKNSGYNRLLGLCNNILSVAISKIHLHSSMLSLV